MPFALLHLLACTPVEPVAVQPSLSDHIGTVIIVDLLEDTAAFDRAWVEFGQDGRFDRSLDFDLAGDEPDRLTLVGFKPDGEVSLRVLVDEGDQTRASEDLVVPTGSQPSWLPPLTVEVDDGAQHFEGGYVLTSNVTTPAAAILLDGDGDYVWWTELDGAHQVGRVRLSQDGRGVYALPINVEGESARGLIFTPWAGGQQTDVDVPGAHHDFVELADGTLGLILEEERDIEGKRVTGDVIVEQAPDGTQTEIWSAWTDLDPGQTPSGLEANQWTHANVLVHDADADDWLLGMMGVRGIARVGRDGSGLRSLLGTAVGDYVDGSGGTDFIERQHVFELVDGGLVYFENSMPETASSRAVELALDEGARTVDEVWSYRPEPELYTFSLGGLDRLPGGDTLVTFSVNGRMDEVSPDGTLRWRISAALGGTFGYSEVVSLPGQ